MTQAIEELCTRCVEIIIHVSYIIHITYSVLLYTVLCIISLLRLFISVPIVHTQDYEVLFGIFFIYKSAFI